MSKKLITAIALGAIGATGAWSQYTPGSTQIITSEKGYSLTNVWAAKPDGITSSTVRQGIGVKDYFFLNDYVNGVVKIYNKDGFVKDITIPEKKAWISNTCDDAGNVIIRCDDELFSADYSYFYNNKSGIAVINPETLELTKDFIPFAELHIAHSSGDRDDVRFDAMGHIYGDVMGSMAHFYAPTTRFGARCEEWVFENGVSTSTEYFTVDHNEAFSATDAKNNQTLGSAMQFGEGLLAVYSNPVSGVTSSSAGLGNGIELYTHDGNTWSASGQYFITPQHSSIGGFFVFDLCNKSYIVYPAGATITGDAYAISEVKYTDSPVSKDTDEEVLIARQYAAMAETTVLNPTSIYYINYNVEPVENESNSVYIYVYNGGSAMSKWKFTVPAPIETGVADIEASDADAPVEFYNLQGMPVAEPADGVYIRRQGGKAAKVFVK